MLLSQVLKRTVLKRTQSKNILFKKIVLRPGLFYALGITHMFLMAEAKSVINWYKASGYINIGAIILRPDKYNKRTQSNFFSLSYIYITIAKGH